MSLSREQEALLYPWSQRRQSFYEDLIELSDGELARLNEAAAACSLTNCAWSTYEAAQMLKQDISAVQAGREAGQPWARRS